MARSFGQRSTAEDSSIIALTLLLSFCVHYASASSTPVVAQEAQTVCKGDTRGDRRCNHDPTHRVCAEIGKADTSFWGFTGQASWCGTIGYYGGQYGDSVRCPPTAPTWCICKWATASWIQGEGCNDNISIDCAATDICATDQGLFFSYDDFDVSLHPARDCARSKCPTQWSACEAANPNYAVSASSAGALGGDGVGASSVLLGGIVVLGVGVMGFRLRDRRAGMTAPGAPATSAGSGSESLTAGASSAGDYGRLEEHSVSESSSGAKYAVV